MHTKVTKCHNPFARLSFLLLLVVGLSMSASAQVQVDINFDVKHVVGDEDSFDREKYIVIHADATEGDYNTTSGLNHIDTLLNTYDAHYGRETGRMRFIGEQVEADPDTDPSRAGFADPADILMYGDLLNEDYGEKTGRHADEFKGRTIVAAQDHPFFPNGTLNSKGFAFSQADDPNLDDDFGTATGEFMGLMIRDAYGTGGTDGPPRPTWIEVINEPFFPLIDFAAPGEEATVEEIFEMHRSVAREVKAANPGLDLKVGGFTNAFPDLEFKTPDNDELFSHWDERWRRFIDEVGEDMDFYSIHLYDFHSIGGGNVNNSGTPGGGVTSASRELLRKGGNIEATLDMIEHYNTIQHGSVKPWLISEYGAQLNDFYSEPWSPQRDWLILKSFSSMMMQFMERPNVIEKTVPFVLGRADFLFGNVTPDRVYPWRMLRGENEPDQLDRDNLEQSVFTEVIKFYELWADVKGTRIDTLSTEIDLMVDAYVNTEDDKAYVILNSLSKDDFTVNLNELGIDSSNITNVNIKHLFQAADGSPQLDDNDFAVAPASIVVKPEATMIVEYTFDAAPTIDETSTESKIYATTYKQDILAGQEITFTIPNVSKGTNGEAVLRMGLGRNAFLSRTPTLTVNDNVVIVPNDYRGDTQLGRDIFPLGDNVFFSLLEIPVPFNFLEDGDNTVKVTFPDGSADEDSGAVSSLSLQLFDFSRAVTRTPAPAPNLDDRTIGITWDNIDSFIPENETLPQFELGDRENFAVSYQTGISSGVEEDLNYVATQIRQIDEFGEIVATSAFNLAVPSAAENSGTTTFSYTIPTNFATGTDNVTPFTDPIPESVDLPPGHQLLLILFMFAGDSSFANANTPIMIGDGAPPVETRARSITFDNIDRFTPADASFPEIAIGQTLDVDITYATGIDNFVEEDLFYVATFVRQEDENGDAVADSAFTTVVLDSADNAASLTYTYDVPSTFTDSTPIPNTADLPPGHQLILIIFMSVNSDTGFADANTSITIGDATDNGAPSGTRVRSLSFDNIADFIPNGETLPRFEIGDILDVDVTYATGIASTPGGLVEEDLNYIAMQVRQFDETGNAVDTSAFFNAVPDSEPNAATTSFSYEIPATFASGNSIPESKDLPDGHKLTLIFFMSVDSDAGFANADTDIIIGELVVDPPIDDRDRAITFNNIADFIPVGQTIPNVDIGDVLDMNISYATGASGGVEEDLAYIATQVRQLDAGGAIVATSAFNVVIPETASNMATTDVMYEIPTNFATGPDGVTAFTDPIPKTVDLPAGHSLQLLLFMSTNNNTFFANANTPITIGDLPPIPDRVRSITFDNIADFIPAGATLPQADIGETLNIDVTYATGASNGIEEDLAYIATQIRQLDDNGATVATSVFNVAVPDTDPNTGTTSFMYTIPSTFATGADGIAVFTGPIPETADLPDGHSLQLLLFMSTDNNTFFADANTEITIGEVPVVAAPDDEICFPIKAKNGNILVICL